MSQVDWQSRIITFIESIGIEVATKPIPASFLPGVTVEQGVLYFDPERLVHCGDLLHEAGHIAVTAPEERPHGVNPDGGLEMASIAWSWAALTHLGLPPDVVFHEDGYRGASQSIIEAFQTGPGFGVPILEWVGMTATGKRAEAAGVEPFPHMLLWVRTKGSM